VKESIVPPHPRNDSDAADFDSKEPLKKNFSLALGLGRIEFCEALHGGDVTLFRDSLALALALALTLALGNL
jgi:hypothetical protein